MEANPLFAWPQHHVTRPDISRAYRFPDPADPADPMTITYDLQTSHSHSGSMGDESLAMAPCLSLTSPCDVSAVPNLIQRNGGGGM